MSVSDLPYSKKVKLAEVPAAGAHLRLVLDETERAQLARHVRIPAILSLTAEIVVKLAGQGAHVTGRLHAEVQQTSVVSLEPITGTVDEAFDVHFLPEEKIVPRPSDAEDSDVDFDPPDAIVDGAVDVGALMTEYFSLGLDPYPRAPGEEFVAPEDGTPEAKSPFAALAKLKDKS
ncbi:MAG: hypothetical protein B7Z15_08880 [Rhizobiales bacterium 32-66-8]|nr:MAG: hypothetical protein B7Z15_08880 [Rhizobiales bacterium 32-66-8]